MGFEQTVTGLQIQPLDEIVAELIAAHQDPSSGWGADVNVRPNSGFGQLINILAEREALNQQLVQLQQSGFDANTAFGTDLDVLAELTGTFRADAEASISGSGLITGTPGTNVPDLSEIRNTGTDEVWRVVGGPYVIGGGGTIPCALQALETGDKVFSTGTVWEIESPLAGWTGFSTVADIDPEDTGRDVESDEELRQRREDEFFIGGNDLSAIKASVIKVKGVDEAAAWENRSCTGPSVDGIPEGAVEMVVEGGDDVQIADAIYDRKPPGTETFGSTNISIVDLEGNPLNIGFTRPTDVDINIIVNIYASASGAEAPLPDNATQLIEDAVLLFGNDNTRISQDVIPGTFHGIIWEILKDPDTGKYSADSIEVLVDLDPIVSPSINPIPIGIRERADYDSARITATVVYV